MENVTLIKRLKAIQSAVSSEIGGLSDLINELVREEMCSELEPAKVNRVKAAERFAKHCKRQLLNVRPSLAGAAVLADGKQYICDSHSVVCYTKPIPGLTQASKSDDVPCFRSTFDEGQKGSAGSLPKLAEMKRVYALFKAQSSKKATHLTCLDGFYFNTSYLIRTMELIGITSGEGKYSKGMLYISGEDCEAILLPMRSVFDDGNIWYPFGPPEQTGENQG